MPKARPAPKAGRALAMMAGMNASNDHSHTDYAAFFEGLDVPCRTVEHAPLFTVQDGIDHGVAELMGVAPEHLVKNLLLRDTHGQSAVPAERAARAGAAGYSMMTAKPYINSRNITLTAVYTPR